MASISTRTAKKFRDNMREAVAKGELDSPFLNDEELADDIVATPDDTKPDDSLDPNDLQHEPIPKGDPDAALETPAPGPDTELGDDKPVEGLKPGYIAVLEQEWDKLQRGYKAIQAAITPAQQENGKLRRENAAMQTRLDVFEGRVDGEGKPKAALNASAMRAKLKELKEVIPEGSDLFDSLIDTAEQVSSMQQQMSEQSTSAQETSRAAVMAQIVTAHPDARQITGQNEFWAWVDSHGQDATSMRYVLQNPWVADPTVTINTLTAFKREMGQGTAPVAAQIAPPKVPTNIAPSSSKTSLGVAPAANAANQGKKLWTDQEWAQRRAELKSHKSTQARKTQIRDEMRDQLRD